MNSDRDTLDNQLLDLLYKLLDNPEAKDVVEQMSQESLGRRRQLIESLATARKEAAKARGDVGKLTRPTARHVESLEQALDVARSAHTLAMGQESLRIMQADEMVAKLANELRDGADSRILAVAKAIRNEITDRLAVTARTMGRDALQPNGSLMLWGPLEIYSNAPSIAAEADRLRECASAVEALAYQDLGPEQIEQELLDLARKAGIPGTDLQPREPFHRRALRAFWNRRAAQA